MLGVGLKVKTSLTSTQFHESLQEVEDLAQNVIGHLGNNDSQMALAIFVIVEAHSQKGPAFTNGFGFGCGQSVTQSIKPQWGG